MTEWLIGLALAAVVVAPLAVPEMAWRWRFAAVVAVVALCLVHKPALSTLLALVALLVVVRLAVTRWPLGREAAAEAEAVAQ